MIDSRQRQKEGTRDAILEAVRACFEDHGYASASVRDIAALAGRVIHHFGSKRELLYAALFEDLEEAMREAASLEHPPPLAAQLDALTRHIFAYYARRPLPSCSPERETTSGLFEKPAHNDG